MLIYIWQRVHFAWNFENLVTLNGDIYRRTFLFMEKRRKVRTHAIQWMPLPISCYTFVQTLLIYPSCTNDLKFGSSTCNDFFWDSFDLRYPNCEFLAVSERLFQVSTISFYVAVEPRTYMACFCMTVRKWTRKKTDCPIFLNN